MWTLEKVAERIIGRGKKKEMKCRNAMIKRDVLPGSQLRALREGILYQRAPSKIVSLYYNASKILMWSLRFAKIRNAFGDDETQIDRDLFPVSPRKLKVKASGGVEAVTSVTEGRTGNVS